MTSFLIGLCVGYLLPKIIPYIIELIKLRVK